MIVVTYSTLLCSSFSELIKVYAAMQHGPFYNVDILQEEKPAPEKISERAGLKTSQTNGVL